MKKLLAQALHSPATVVMVVLTFLATLAVRGSRPRGADRTPLLAQQPWFGPMSLVGTSSVLMFLVMIAALVVLVPMLERVLGRRRTMPLALGVALLGVAVAEAIRWGLRLLDDADLSEEGQYFPVIAPLGLTVSLVFLGAATMSTLWRVRVQTTMWAVLVSMLLFSGGSGELAYIAIAALMPPIAALAIHGNSDRLSRRNSRPSRRAVMSLVIAVLAVGPLVASISHQGGLFSAVTVVFDTTRDRVIGHAGASAPGGLLIYASLLLLLAAAYWVYRGRRIALWTAVVMLGFSLLSVAVFVAQRWRVLLDDSDSVTVMQVIVVQAMLVVLLYAAALVYLGTGFRHVPVRPTRQVLLRYLGTVVLALLVAWLLYAVLVAAGSSGFSGRPTFEEALLRAPTQLLPLNIVGLDNPITPLTPVAVGISRLPSVLLYLTALVALWQASSWYPVPDRIGRDELMAALHRGGDAVSYMGTWPAARQWIDRPTGAVIPYQEANGCAVTLGGIIGDQGVDHAAVIGRFAEHQRHLGLQPVLYSVPEHYRTIADQMGWMAVAVASESVLPLAEFTMTGKKKQDLRSAVNRAEREGVEAIWTRYQDLTVAQAHQIEAMSQQWVGDHPLPEMGFTLGGLAQLDDPEVRLMLAIGTDGVIQAVTSWLPLWRDGSLVGYTLDFMRRGEDAMNGVMEFLICRAALLMQEQGLEQASLSGAPLAGRSDPEPDHQTDQAIDSVLDYLAESLEPAYGFASLYRFKQKFAPEHHQMLMLAPDFSALPTIGVALLRLYLPQLSTWQLARLGVELPASARGDKKSEKKALAPA